jgi:phosphate starvation-inducible PhoH-like protein
MTESTTLQFDDARTLQALFANDLSLLKEVERELGVRVTTRDGWLRIDGVPESVEASRALFDDLSATLRAGVPIARADFLYALGSAVEGGRENLGGLADARIQCSPQRPPVIPKTLGQRGYIRAMGAHDMVFGVGPAGTGKTYLAVAMAVSALKRGSVNRIILTRPAVEAGEALGFLPGDLREKIFPYLRPLYDALHDMLDPAEIEKLVDRGVIEIAPLAYMRGRTLNHAFVILDEAQNTTTEQMFMFLTRLGADSRAVVTGDRTQIDLPPNKRSGLIEALDVLADVPGIAFTFFDETDVIRHTLVQNIVRAYQSHRSRPKP